MEFMGLIQELNQGKQLANQLRNHLRPSLSSSSSDGILLIDKILRSYENALSVLACDGGVDELISAVNPINAPVKVPDASKKRKVMPKWSEQIKVPSDSAIEAPLGDGFSWRKYGQKDILGSKFPRSYFRCSHRFSKGCLATKQVQRSDNDPTMNDITYKGRHTCNRGTLHSNTPPQEKLTKPLLLQQHPMPPKQEQKPLLVQQQQQQHEPLCFTFSSDAAVRVKSENLDDIDVDGGVSRPFRSPSSPWFGSEVQDDQSSFRESHELSPTFELDDIFGSCCDFDTGFVSVPNSVSNVSIGDLEEYCSFDNLELLY